MKQLTADVVIVAAGLSGLAAAVAAGVAKKMTSSSSNAEKAKNEILNQIDLMIL